MNSCWMYGPLKFATGMEYRTYMPNTQEKDRLECRNYRGITLFNVTYKIFTNILNERLKPWAEKTLHNYQCGFRPGKSTSNQIFTIWKMLENILEHDIETYHLFVDFRTV
jgi:sorting nexin-29